MSEQKLDQILSVLTRVERKIDTQAVTLSQHLVDDAATHAALRRQRGFVSTLAAMVVAIAAGVVAAAKWLAGR